MCLFFSQVSDNLSIFLIGIFLTIRWNYLLSCWKSTFIFSEQCSALWIFFRFVSDSLTILSIVLFRVSILSFFSWEFMWFFKEIKIFIWPFLILILILIPKHFFLFQITLQSFNNFITTQKLIPKCYRLINLHYLLINLF